MLDATFACPDLTTFTRLDGLGLEVTGRRLEQDVSVGARQVRDGLHAYVHELEMTSGDVTTTMSMPGMMSDADMQQLTAASGTEFDRLFLQQMIVHHQGALEMADTELAQGSNTAALALAQSIKTSQTAEITEMQQMLQTL